MKTLTARTYIKHIKRIKNMDSNQYRPVPDARVHEAGRKSVALLASHGMLDSDECAIDWSKLEPTDPKRIALAWWEENV